MAGERLTLDPITEDTANAPLELHDLDNGLALLEHAYPLGDEARQWAESADTEGARLASRRPVNRTITVKVRAAEPTDPASINLATNPKAAKGTTDWTNTSLTTFERVLLDGLAGPLPSAAMPPGVETGFHGVGDASLDRGSITFPVTNGRTLRYSVWVYLDTSSATGVQLRVDNAAGTSKGASSTLSALDAWTRLDTGAIVADATETWRLRVQQNGAGATNFYWTAVLIEESSSLGVYFDCDTPGCGATGVPHASSSTRAAAGGDRINAIIDDLQAKVAKLQRERGTLRRVLPNGDPITFEIEAANIDVPADKAYLARRRAEVTLTLECQPYGRGAEVVLSDHVEATLPVLVFTETGIKGNVSALARLVIDNDSANSQSLLWWGIQSRHYDPAATAALFYEAENALFDGGAATAVGTAGASGAGNNVRKITALSITDYLDLINTTAPIGDAIPPFILTHTGTFRVLARVLCPATNAGIVDVRLSYMVGAKTTVMPPVRYDPSWEGSWRLLDLGLVTTDRALWTPIVQAISTVANDDIELDYFVLIPVDEGAGKAGSIAGEPKLLPIGASYRITHEDQATLSLGDVYEAWRYEGDYLKIPPAGRERRSTRIVIKISRGDLDGAADDGIDDVSAVLAYTPRYLVVPQP